MLSAASSCTSCCEAMKLLFSWCFYGFPALSYTHPFSLLAPCARWGGSHFRTLYQIKLCQCKPLTPPTLPSPPTTLPSLLPVLLHIRGKPNDMRRLSMRPLASNAKNGEMTFMVLNDNTKSPHGFLLTYSTCRLAVTYTNTPNGWILCCIWAKESIQGICWTILN